MTFRSNLAMVIMVGLLAGCGGREVNTDVSTDLVTLQEAKIIAINAFRIGQASELPIQYYPWMKSLADKDNKPRPGSFSVGDPILVSSGFDLSSIPEQTNLVFPVSKRVIPRELVAQGLGDYYYFPLLLENQRVGGFFQVPQRKINGQPVATIAMSSRRKVWSGLNGGNGANSLRYHSTIRNSL